jgi:predicted nucleotidyltransferase
MRTVGLTEPLRQCLAPYADRIKAAFVYGSVAKGTDIARSDIDLMVIGEDLTYSDLYAGLEQAEMMLKRPVDPKFLSPEAWRRRLEQKINAQPRIFIFGSENVLQI